MTKNKELAEILEKMAKILEFNGENPFKISAYLKAAGAIRNLSQDIEKIAKDERLEEIPGIGKSIANKIKEYLNTGEIKAYKKAISDVPEGILELMDIQGIGPKTLRLIYEKLHIRSLDDLRRVINDGSLATLPLMGEKRVENIKKSIEFLDKTKGRLLINDALILAEEVVRYLNKDGLIIEIAGSLRRRKETIGDIDLLASSDNKDRLIETFIKMPDIERVIASGATKGSIILKGTQVDLRIVDKNSYGSALQYFTGSKMHNIKLRKISREKGFKLNEYGVFDGDKKIAGETEEDVYNALGLPWIPPELREDTGEIEAAKSGKLPNLVKMEDIKGDLHVHSNYSDGTLTLEDIVKEASVYGYEYVSVSDHSQSVKYAKGLSIDRLKRRNEEIDRINKDNNKKNIVLLKGTEVDILRDGSLDYPDDILEELDIVIAAIHQGFKNNINERMLSAMKNPNVDIIAHPTGRVIYSREGYKMDIERLINDAKSTDTILEINSYPNRMDFNDINCKKAKENGIKMSLGTDTHSKGMMKYMELGLSIARRGWLEKEDLINTYPLEELKDKLY
ncbi:MAG: DNA polymerase/3'-5' exonuclease PolX [Candidatus Methanoliparum thermophilum]|uniref:DNA polymerase beta n=1 Tax=Methanoliparum thermophilum TaxID=2491083 RepID=A0A520KR08_METT2|nr:DNA polymerase/3'-5' exonuclease PolX [Candidatus Methanoliparum sp. LAM-1]RZN63794.1 MAG: DNA polymerase/3'-5' exonuclease PolX [Candidatus Methanoliparum thermophilum]BDC36484.1 DNA polymerase/3'-5' exonuclease PolX [Candidatus Methanoliparum sp. LAM-1]